MADAILDIQDLAFAYDREPILTDVSLQLYANELVCIVGPNGGGKTTLLRLILGMLRPSRGSLTVFGTTPRRAREHLGYVPQYAQFDAKFPVNVMDVVLMGRLGKQRFGFYNRHDWQAARDALAEVDLKDLERRHFADLSGGQRQRVLIARALASQPRLLLLDEPTSNIDAAVEQRLYDLLRHLSERLTVVLVSHDLGVVSRMVSTVVCVNRRVEVHPTSELSGKLVREMYGGDIALVRHDHRCAHEGHECSPS